MSLGMLVIKSFYFMLPAYLANAAPVLTKNVLKSLARPLDMGHHLRGRPLFGSHKTLRGLLAAIVAGIVVFLVQVCLHRFPLFQGIELFDYSSFYSQYYILPGFLLGFGAIMGDLVESLIKRQASINAGGRWIPWDQVDFLIGALLLFFLIYIPSWKVIVILFVLTPLIHIGMNHLAFYLNIRKVKW
ncbi:MAG: CDP-archaeol synthase [Candidatus Woesearchaeota archaeon]